MLDGRLNSGYKMDSIPVSTTRKCSFFNRTMCDGDGCKREEECKISEGHSDKSTLCYALWFIHNNQTTFELKGCWVGNVKDCPGGNACIETRKDTKKNLYYCCCNGDLCNEQVYHQPSPVQNIHKDTGDSSIRLNTNNTNSSVNTSFLYLGFIVSLIFIAVAIILWLYRYRKTAHFNEVSTNDEHHITSTICENPKRYFPPRSINLIEVKATGRFGAVYKASVGNIGNNNGLNGIISNGQIKHCEKERYVAVKVFPQQDKASWLKEVEVYELPNMRHENILNFLGTEEYNIEYWLITEYHEHGSLTDYLKSHLINYEQMWNIVDGVARGLAFLHEPSANKPAIAHRDFKSKNVLLKNDLTPCIADFGLAFIFYPGYNPYEALGQVGTRRYMAPEVLEGAICFSPDGLFRIDMYAYGLVIWEVVTRFSGQIGPIGNYMLPFEEEIGSHPTLEDIQEIVCQQRKRPEIKSNWLTDQRLTIFCETMKDCWDQDAEARITASCVAERFNSLRDSNHCYH